MHRIPTPIRTPKFSNEKGKDGWKSEQDAMGDGRWGERIHPKVQKAGRMEGEAGYPASPTVNTAPPIRPAFPDATAQKGKRVRGKGGGSN